MFFQTFTAESVLLLEKNYANRKILVDVIGITRSQQIPIAAYAKAPIVNSAAVSILYLCGSGSESGNESLSGSDPDSDQHPAHLMYCIVRDV